jgi:hypothetical protein
MTGLHDDGRHGVVPAGRPEDPAETAEWEAAKRYAPGGHLPPRPPVPGPTRPNPSAPSGGAGRGLWFVVVALVAWTALSYAIGYQVATDSFERKLDAADNATEFVVGSCDP